MYKKCTTEKSTQQQRQIEACLLELMKKQPYQDISVSSLCEKSGLSRNTFYRLFESKEDVLCALIDHTLTDYVKYQLPPCDTASDVPRGLLRFYSYWYHQKPLLDALHRNKQSSLLHDQSIQHVIQEDSGALHWFGADCQPHGREIMLFMISGIFSLMIDWHQSGYNKTVPEIARITHQLLTEPPLRFPTITNEK